MKKTTKTQALYELSKSGHFDTLIEMIYKLHRNIERTAAKAAYEDKEELREELSEFYEELEKIDNYISQNWKKL